jgi:hypothetical protein
MTTTIASTISSQPSSSLSISYSKANPSFSLTSCSDFGSSVDAKNALNRQNSIRFSSHRKNDIVSEWEKKKLKLEMNITANNVLNESTNKLEQGKTQELRQTVEHMPMPSKELITQEEEQLWLRAAKRMIESNLKKSVNLSQIELVSNLQKQFSHMPVSCDTLSSAVKEIYTTLKSGLIQNLEDSFGLFRQINGTNIYYNCNYVNKHGVVVDKSKNG